MRVTITKPVEANLVKLYLSAKVSDFCSAELRDEDGKIIWEQDDGYIPYFLPIAHSDYLELEIDLDTGQILNWKPISPQALENFLDEQL